MKTKLIKSQLFGEYTCAVLDNGLSVYVMEKPNFASSYAVFGTKYGSIDTKFSRNGQKETEVPAGIAHFLEHKLFESEEGDTFERFAKTGAYANAFTSFDRTCYLFSCTKNFEENLDILLDFVQSPYFTAETVEKEQGIIAQEIKMYEDNPGWRVLFNMLSSMYENHPVKIDIAGTVDSISKIDHNLLYECYKTFYNPSNMYVCIAGNIKTSEVLDQVQRSIKKTEKVTVARAKFKEENKVKSSYVEQSLEVARPIFCLGFKDCIDTEPTARDKMVCAIALELLAGDCSELYRRLVDTSLIGEDFSSEYFQGDGYSAIIFEGESESPEAVAEEIKKEIKTAITKGINETLLEAVKKSAYGDAVKRFDNTEAIVMGMVECAVSGGTLFESAETLKSISSEDIIDRLKALSKSATVLSVINPKRKG